MGTQDTGTDQHVTLTRMDSGKMAEKRSLFEILATVKVKAKINLPVASTMRFRDKGANLGCWRARAC